MSSDLHVRTQPRLRRNFTLEGAPIEQVQGPPPVDEVRNTPAPTEPVSGTAPAPTMQTAADAFARSQAESGAEHRRFLLHQQFDQTDGDTSASGPTQRDDDRRLAELEAQVEENREQYRDLPTNSFSGYVRQDLDKQLTEIQSEIDEIEIRNLERDAIENREQYRELPSNSFSGYVRQGLDAELEGIESDITDLKIQGLERDREALAEQIDALPDGQNGRIAEMELQDELDAIDAQLASLRTEQRNAENQEWFDNARDGVTVSTEKFTAGGEIDIPTPTGAEVTTGAAVDLTRSTKADGSVVVGAQINGSLGTEVAEILDIELSGSLGAQYTFDSEEEAQEFIDAVREAADIPQVHEIVRFDPTGDSPFGLEISPANAIAEVLQSSGARSHRYQGGLEVSASVGADIGNAGFNITGAAGIQRDFTNDVTTVYGQLGASASADLGLTDKFKVNGSVRASVAFDDDFNPSTLTITGQVSGSAPVNGLIESLGAATGEDDPYEVIPGNRNNESLGADVTIKLDLTDVEDRQAVQDLVNGLMSSGAHGLTDDAVALFEQGDVVVNVTSTDSGVAEADIGVAQFEIGNAETENIVSFGRPSGGEFERLY